MIYKSIVTKLTNWQRNQWARAGYPGSKGDGDPEILSHYLSLTRETRAKAQREEERKG